MIFATNLKRFSLQKSGGVVIGLLPGDYFAGVVISLHTLLLFSVMFLHICLDFWYVTGFAELKMGMASTVYRDRRTNITIYAIWKISYRNNCSCLAFLLYTYLLYSLIKLRLCSSLPCVAISFGTS